MASSREYLSFILDQLSELEGITYRSMMGEYILYYHGRIACYICDDQLFAKPVPAALAYAPQAVYPQPYEGAKEMLLIEDVDDSAFLTGLFEAMYGELPPPSRKKRKCTDP